MRFAQQSQTVNYPRFCYQTAMSCWFRAAALLLLVPGVGAARQHAVASMAAGPGDPVFTTYAAPLSRSEYLVDEGYHLRFYDPGKSLALTSDTAGSWGVGFELDGMLVHSVGDYVREPIVRRSFASLARFDFEPGHRLHVDVTFAVHSSRQSILALRIENRADRTRRIGVHVFATAPEDGFGQASLTSEGDGLSFSHSEPRGAWSESPPPEYENDFRDLLLMDARADVYGAYPSGHDAMLHELARGLVSGDLSGSPEALLLGKAVELEPGRSVSFRIVRASAPRSEASDVMHRQARTLLNASVADLEQEAVRRFEHAPRLQLEPDDELIYWGALALARQSMLPAEGRAQHDYYVFSREPTWSWGHDGQVFHESLSMLAYAYLDPLSAMESQRVFMEAQDPDGYIPYRVGPYVVRTFPVEGEKTTSAPFFSWINWEVYRVARERVPNDAAREFLEDAFRSGSKFTEFLVSRRDADGDGLLEWGGHAVLESVRDSQVPIWDLLGEDDPSAPSRIEALDLSSMVVQEMRSLAHMATELGEPDSWTERADRLATLIDETMWDDATGFYYNVDRDTNRFVTPDGIDLRRMEIIGFLPVWAGIASPERTSVLVDKLTDPKKFWRRFGVPTLAADDPGFDPIIRRCCQWNGAVWLEWDYLVFDGLRRYGHNDIARELGKRMLAAAATQLRRNHRFWESYSPDEVKLASPSNYIWNSILARVLIDMEHDAQVSGGSR